MPREIADKLRDRIRKSGKSYYQLAKETGIQQSTISRFMNGKDIGMRHGGTLAHHLGLDLLEPPSKRK